MPNNLDLAIAEHRRLTNVDIRIGILGDGSGSGDPRLRDGSGKYWVRFQLADRYTAPVSLPCDTNANIVPTDGLAVEVGYINGEQCILRMSRNGLRQAGQNPIITNPVDPDVNKAQNADGTQQFYCHRSADPAKPWTVVVESGYHEVDGVSHVFITDEIDLSSFVPSAGEQVLACVYVASDDTLEAFASTAKLPTDAIVAADIDECRQQATAGSMSVWGWLLDGDASGLDADVSKNIDLRPFFSEGGGGGGGSISDATVSVAGKVLIDTVPTSGTPIAVTVPIVDPHAFGDSITNGVGASDGAHTYIALLGGLKGWSINNHSSNGQMAPDQANPIYSLTVAENTLSTYFLGANDERFYTTSGLRQDFQAMQLVELAWLAIPASNKVLGTDTGAITYAGSWSDTVAYGLGKNSNTNGDTATFNVYGSNIVIGSIAFGSDQGVDGAFTIEIDGNLYDTYSSKFNGVITTQFSRNYAPFAIVITGLGEAEHQIVITVTSATDAANPVYLDWYASTRGVLTNDGPWVYVSNCIRADTSSYSINGGSEANVTAFNAIIKANAGLLANMGLNVTLVDNVNVINPTSDLGDGLHPNDTGHAKIAQAFSTAMSVKEYARDRQGAAYPLSTGLIIKEVDTPANVPPGYQIIFPDRADGHIKRVNASGTVVDLESGIGLSSEIWGPISSGDPTAPLILDSDGRIVLARRV